MNRTNAYVQVIVLIIISYLIVGPLLVLFVSSLSAAGDRLPWESAALSIENYVTVYSDPKTYMVLMNSLIFAVYSLSIGFLVSISIAWVTERTDIPFRNAIFAFAIAPMAVPGMLSAISWVLLLSPEVGLINVMLRSFMTWFEKGPFNIYSLTGMSFVEGLRMVPTLTLMIAASFRNMDPSLEEASRVAGRNTMQTLRFITLPVLKPALLGALLYYFIVAIESFEIPGIIGMTINFPVFSTGIYWATHPDGGLPNYGYASTLSIVLIVIALVSIWFYGKQTRQAENFRTITGKGFRPNRIELGKAKYVLLFGLAVYIIFSVFMPFIILLWASFQPFYSVPSLAAFQTISLTAYENVFHYPTVNRSVTNTFYVMVGTTVGMMALSTFSAWIVVRQRSTMSRLIDLLSFLPQAIPGVVIGLSLMFVYLFIPIPIYGTVWIIILALITKYIAFGSRAMNGAMLQISGELEEASRVAGASIIMTFRRIIFPLLIPALINIGIWVAVHAMRELTAALMLYSPQSIVLSTLIWSFWQNGNIAEAAVIGVILTFLLSVLTYLGRYVSVKLEK